MRIFKPILLFLMGGLLYMLLEICWRGWSHGSMFLAGGTCFLLLGRLQVVRPRLPLIPRAALGALVITMVELLAGLLFNREYAVWDYRAMPLNYFGQVCLPFSILWMPVGLAAMGLYAVLDRQLQGATTAQ